MKVLVAPLNWGLGHATRCIPIIQALQNNNIEVVIASDGRALQLLKAEFPENIFFELPGYNIRYTSSNLALSLLYQTPKILWAIRREHKKIREIVAGNQITAIVSDNRYGAYHTGIQNIFLSHQINIITKSKLLSSLASKTNKWLISNFQKLWIPDLEEKPGLAGNLSHNHGLEANYVGILSRMKKKEVRKKYDIAVVLSGPEPMRTEFEKKITRQLLQIRNKKIIIIQGMPDNEENVKLSQNVRRVSFMPARELNMVMLSSDMIIARSGYSTIMDLWKLEKRALLIPTPGQTEQIYLAKQLEAEGLFLTQNEDEMDLEKAISQIGNYSGFSENGNDSRLEHVIIDTFNLITKNNVN